MAAFRTSSTIAGVAAAIPDGAALPATVIVGALIADAAKLGARCALCGQSKFVSNHVRHCHPLLRRDKGPLALLSLTLADDVL